MHQTPLHVAVGVIEQKRKRHNRGRDLDTEVLKVSRSEDITEAGRAFHWRTVRGRKLSWWCEEVRGTRLGHAEL